MHAKYNLSIIASFLAAFVAGCGQFKTVDTSKFDSVPASRKFFNVFKRDSARTRLFPIFGRSKARNDRLWRPDLSILSHANFDGNKIFLQNVRNCRYRSDIDYDVRHYDLEFDLRDVVTVDFVIVPFTNMPLLAHTMLSFGLKNGQYFAISVEGRMEQGEDYSATSGASDDFELIYLIGDERDLILLRTDVRKVDVYIYAGKATPEQVQNLLVDMLRRCNELAVHPEFYNTFKNNCTTNLVDHVNRLHPGKIPRDWRVIFPGHSDKLLFDLGLLDVTGTFEEARQHAKINQRADVYRDDPNFSHRIREFQLPTTVEASDRR